MLRRGLAGRRRRRLGEEAAPVTDEDAERSELTGFFSEVGDSGDDDAADQTGGQCARDGRPSRAGVQGHARVVIGPGAGHMPVPGVGVLACAALGLADSGRLGRTGVDGNRYVSDAVGWGFRHSLSVLPILCAGQARLVAAPGTRVAMGCHVPCCCAVVLRQDCHGAWQWG